MTAANHALTGAVIGLSLPFPPLAIPLAFVSHFILDVLPHFASERLLPKNSVRFIYYLILEAILCGLIVLALMALRPENWLLAAFCAFVATSPDFMWVKEFIAAQTHAKTPVYRHWLVKFHSSIQWYQKEPGIIVEIAWAGLMLLTLANLLVI